MTLYNSQTAKGEYRLQFETDDYDKFRYVEEAARRCVDNRHKEVCSPVVHAHFVPTEYDGYADGNPVWDTWECSNCHEEFHSDGEEPCFSYCPYCGARINEK